jgi:hypothetical protein
MIAIASFFLSFLYSYLYLIPSFLPYCFPDPTLFPSSHRFSPIPSSLFFTLKQFPRSYCSIPVTFSYLYLHPTFLPYSFPNRPIATPPSKPWVEGFPLVTRIRCYLLQCCCTVFMLKSQDISIGMAKGKGLDGRGLFPCRGNIFYLFHSFLANSEAQPVSYLRDNGAYFLGIKRPGREANHSPPSSAEVKNCGTIPPLPDTCFVT